MTSRFINDLRDILPVLRQLLGENGNREVAAEADPWDAGNTMYVYANKLLITKEQASLIKKYLHNLKAGHEQDFFFVQNETGGKSRVIWQGSSDYALMQKQKADHADWQKKQDATRQRIAEGIAAARASGKVTQPGGIRIEAKTLEQAQKNEVGSDRSAVLNRALRASGVEFLSENPQPDGVYFYLLGREVEIPRTWYAWFEEGSHSFFSVGYRSINGLSFDWNRYAVADEESYIQHKCRIW
ncbi:MAG: hypothetical protein J0L53_15125 [Spirochaetes bacterium]|nr:hypothetical protein [Spirochaetota bacterium]